MNITTRTTSRTASRLGVLLTAAVLALSGCAATDSTTAAVDTTPATAADSVTISDAWVKAAESGMSGAFGTLTNSGTEDVNVVSAATTASSMMELHETVENSSGEMMMRQKEGGFVIPAGGSLELAPGGNHIMLMNLVEPLMAGAEVSFTLTFSDGSSVEFTAPVKDYSGANENYESGESDMDMGDK